MLGQYSAPVLLGEKVPGWFLFGVEYRAERGVGNLQQRTRALAIYVSGAEHEPERVAETASVLWGAVAPGWEARAPSLSKKASRCLDHAAGW
jgi:hypothetical protein